MAFDETLHDTFGRLGDRLGAELRSAAEQLTCVLREEREREAAEAEAVRAAIQAPDRSLNRSRIDERLASGVRTICAARSLGEVLDALASCAGVEAKRAAVLIVRGDRFHGWCFVGFDDIADAPVTIDLGDEAAGVLADAARTEAVVAGRAPSFAAHTADRRGLALPITLGGKVVAVLYADEGIDAAVAGDTGAAARLDVLASCAARSLEAQTAFKTAHELIARADMPLRLSEPRTPAPFATHGASSDDAVGAGGDDDASAARGYARLLVAEITLYHEPAVVAGRRMGDLAQRLGDEIARARHLYEERVPPHVRHRTDVFDNELVQTLAGGDATLLALQTSPS